MAETLQQVGVLEKLERAKEIKESLIDFVYDAEGDVAIALEEFSAEQLGRWTKPNLAGLDRTALAVDMFLSEGSVGTRSVLDLFLDESDGLSDEDKALVQSWAHGFNGLFVVRSIDAGSYVLINWLTEKEYGVRATDEQSSDLLARMSPGEIVMTRLLPLEASVWMMSGPLTLLGKLGKPKLAVAIGNFKKWFPHQLYGDAPELKEMAWESVRQQYEDFVELFGGEQTTMSGHELNKKFQIYQEKTTESQMVAAGIDSSKSLKENMQQAGISEEEIADAIDEIGEENAAAKKLMESSKAMKMVMPKASLPDEFRSAEAVTVFVHPQWGQTLRKDYASYEEVIAQSSTNPEHTEAQTKVDRYTQKYLEDEQVNAHVWHSIAESHGEALEASLRRVLNKPDFEIRQDLDNAIARYGKSLEPELPESASVPEHLHNLFQEAIAAVGKAEKPKKKAKKKSGFGG